MSDDSPPDPLSPSPAAFALVRYFTECKVFSYFDLAGRARIGFDHLMNARERDLYRDGINLATAEQLLAEDLRLAGIHINSLTPGVTLAQHEFDALTCLVFDIGLGAFAKSPIICALKDGEKEDAAIAFGIYRQRYRAATGSREWCPVRAVKREHEQRLFRTGDWQ